MPTQGGSIRCEVRSIIESNRNSFPTVFFLGLGDELHLPKVMTDTDTVASVSTDPGVLTRARSRHYLNGKTGGL